MKSEVIAENVAILNYPGSKRKLLNFIFQGTADLIDKNKEILDIFCGTGSVAEMYKKHGYSVRANDAEVYSCNIARAILNGVDANYRLSEKFLKSYKKNSRELMTIFKEQVAKESEFLESESVDLVDFDNNLIKIWRLGDSIRINNITISSINDLRKNKTNLPYCLFSLYYAGSYFGIEQAIEIDSLRYAIEQDKENVDALLASLYYAIKECSFSKDGHLAQPLSHEKNFSRLIKTRRKSVFNLFERRLKIFCKEGKSNITSAVTNMAFEDLIKDTELLSNVGFIYADPPYTDMQYSRYFHLLTTVTEYTYPNMTIKKGNVTSGLYADNRFQSAISNRKSSLNHLTKLMEFASAKGITLAFSYAYPIDPATQATDRYTMPIDSLINSMKAHFKNVKVITESYKHCNNRNSMAKKVYEYLIIGYGGCNE